MLAAIVLDPTSVTHERQILALDVVVRAEDECDAAYIYG